MLDKLRELLAGFNNSNGSLISLLQDTQDSFGYLPKEALLFFAEELDIPASRLFGIATFYAQFHLKPRGKNIITACCGTACHVRGSERIINAAVRELGLKDYDDTTEDGEFTLEKMACLGACSLAPVFSINGKVKGKINSDSVIKEIKKLKKARITKTDD
jgi:NADH-quinone oxidoreductase subunit E